MRAQASALMLFVLNMAGPGAGTFVAGLLTDVLSGRFGIDAIRYSLSLTTLMAFAGIACALMAAKALPRRSAEDVDDALPQAAV